MAGRARHMGRLVGSGWCSAPRRAGRSRPSSSCPRCRWPRPSCRRPRSPSSAWAPGSAYPTWGQMIALGQRLRERGLVATDLPRPRRPFSPCSPSTWWATASATPSIRASSDEISCKGPGPEGTLPQRPGLVRVPADRGGTPGVMAHPLPGRSSSSRLSSSFKRTRRTRLRRPTFSQEALPMTRRPALLAAVLSSLSPSCRHGAGPDAEARRHAARVVRQRDRPPRFPHRARLRNDVGGHERRLRARQHHARRQVRGRRRRVVADVARRPALHLQAQEERPLPRRHRRSTPPP